MPPKQTSKRHPMLLPVQSIPKHRAKQKNNNMNYKKSQSLVSAGSIPTAESLADAEPAASSAAIHMTGQGLLEGRLRD